MNLYKKGNLAKSIAGHDKNQIFVIMKEEGEYVYLADGRLRMTEKPKRKNKKHVQPINNELVPDIIRNEDAKRVIKLYLLKENSKSEKEGCAVAAQER